MNTLGTLLIGMSLGYTGAGMQGFWIPFIFGVIFIGVEEYLDYKYKKKKTQSQPNVKKNGLSK